MKMMCCSENASVKFVVKGPEKTMRLTALGEQRDANIRDEERDSIAEKILLVPRIKHFSESNFENKIIKGIHQL